MSFFEDHEQFAIACNEVQNGKEEVSSSVLLGYGSGAFLKMFVVNGKKYYEICFGNKKDSLTQQDIVNLRDWCNNSLNTFKPSHMD